MEHSLSYRFDRTFLRNVLKRDFFWRGAIGIGVIVVAIGALFLLSVLSTEVLIGALGGVLVAIGLLPLRFRRAVDNAYGLWLRQSPGGSVTCRIDDEGIELRMEQGSARYAWGDLRRLWRYPDVWLLEVVRNFSLPLPPEAASAEVRDFIVERCRSAGVRT